eukprot:scaffold144081_cov24-Prasinocladus_malaysianus.AAC.1
MALVLFSCGHTLVDILLKASLGHLNQRRHSGSEVGTEDSDTPIGLSPGAGAAFGHPSLMGASPMSLGCTPTNGFGAYMVQSKAGLGQKRK